MSTSLVFLQWFGLNFYTTHVRQELLGRHAEFLIDDRDLSTLALVGAYTLSKNYSPMGATKGPQASIMERIRFEERIARYMGSSA